MKDGRRADGSATSFRLPDNAVQQIMQGILASCHEKAFAGQEKN